MMTRRIFEGALLISVLVLPARATVRMWGRRQLGARADGTLLHTLGEIVVTVL